jgi:hypothetical protein
MQEKLKELSAKLLPYFLVFLIGNIVGTASAIYSLEKDCSLMGKTRISDKVFSCEKK